MTYGVSILRRAQRELRRLPRDEYERICEAVQALANDPRPTGSRALAGREGRRIRVGNYRVIFEIDDTQHTVVILHVGHRRDVYR